MTDKLGKPPNLAGALRDAVHIPIIALYATEAMAPGTPIRLTPHNTAMAKPALAPEFAIGVVDPFLARTVTQGEWFWALLVPDSITSLRHDWVHPAFPAAEKDEEEYDDDAYQDGCRREGCW